MNREQLLERLQYFLSSEHPVGAVLFFVLEKEGETILKKADIDGIAQETLGTRFLSSLGETFIQNEEFHYLNLSNADERSNVIYRYDLDEELDIRSTMGEVLVNDNIELFRFNHEKLENLTGFLILIGDETNKIVLYKKKYPVNLFKRDRFVLVPVSNTRFVKADQDILVIDKKFDFMLIDKEFLIVKLQTLESTFGYDEAIKSKAQKTILKIEELKLLDDIQPLIELAWDLSNAKKLVKVRNSPVLRVSAANVIYFIQNHRMLTGKIHLNKEQTKIVLDTGTSKRLFLKLLNDDYLFSQLTEVQYDTIAKDELT